MIQFELIAQGYGLVEAPRVDSQGRLLFCDNLNGGVYRRAADGSIEVLLPDRKGVGGMAFNRDGGIVMSGEDVALWNEPTGTVRKLFGGHPGRVGKFFNDLTVDSHGSVYVGTVNGDSSTAGKQKVPPGDLYRVDPEGTSTLLCEGIPASNGLGFSPDGRLLYHANSMPGQIWVQDVGADRSVRDRRLFAKIDDGWPDGLAVDAEGGIWVAVVFSSCVMRFRSDGTLDRKVELPVKKVVSLVFGGADLRDLYVVTAQSRSQKGAIYRGRSDIPGLPLPLAHF
ncbi:MAG TPA: SMP-30/gluconolactonase/LRE family protein [Candidatus Binataceae bacterium]|nr:SMP-30/gluconolactonase/LRE family protein [Candidatus Binataceae bacterium]